MKMQRTIELISMPILFLSEYLLKLTAGISGLIVLGAEGSFFGKIGAGFSSLADVYRRMASWPGKATYLGDIIKDYNTMTASEFNREYGGEAVNRVMLSLNEAVTYLQEVYNNVSEQPVATVIAALFSFFLFYISARICRFIRQRGKGSILVQKERELGEKVFDR